MTTEIIEVTPELASEFLTKNTSNRPVSEMRVRQYVDAMERDQWQFNGDTVRFSECGNLIDGQHRLTAIVRSGKCQKMIIVHGLNGESFTTIDNGKVRSAADSLYINGFKYSNSIAALAKKILLWNSGYFHVLDNSKKEGGAASGRRLVPPSNDDILNFVRMFDLTPYVAKSYSLSARFNGLKNGEYAMLYYLFSSIDTDDADDFFNIFTTGVSSNEYNPSVYVRNKIIKSLTSNFSFTARVKLIMIIKAWNLFRKREECRIIKIGVGEEVPKIL